MSATEVNIKFICWLLFTISFAHYKTVDKDTATSRCLSDSLYVCVCRFSRLFELFAENCTSVIWTI